MLNVINIDQDQLLQNKWATLASSMTSMTES